MQHSYSGVITAEAGCTETGVKTYTCSGSGDGYAETISALGHSYDSEWTVDIEHCTELGSKSHHCVRCDAKTDITEIPATGEHKYTIGICGCGDVDADYEWYYGESSPYEIGTGAQLAAFVDIVNSGVSFTDKTVRLTDDVEVNGFIGIGAGKTGVLETGDTSFDGIFDGRGYEITITNSSTGLFGVVGQNGRVINTGVNADISYIKDEASYRRWSSMAARASIGAIANVNKGQIENSSVFGTITTDVILTGGIAGKNQGLIKNCLFNAEIIWNGKLASECIDENAGGYRDEAIEERWGAIAGQNDGQIEYSYYNIEDDLNNPKHSGPESSGVCSNVNMYTWKYYVIGFISGAPYVGKALNKRAQENTEYVSWIEMTESCPKLTKGQ